jgi:hypothetical protein
MDAGSTLGSRPADEPVARAQVPRRRAKGQRTDGLTLRVSQVLELLTIMLIWT